MQVHELRDYIRAILIETTNQDFLKGLADIGGEWDEVQKNIPTEDIEEWDFIHFYNEETDEMDQGDRLVKKTVQRTGQEKKPEFAKEDPKFFDRRHEAERRVVYGQTQSEIDVERKLMQLWQKHADIEFFKSNKITFCHNLAYPSAGKGMGKSSKAKKSPVKQPMELIKAQDSKQNNAISCYGVYNTSGDFDHVIKGQIGTGWGFVLSGHPIFASETDLASQTQYMATAAAEEYYKSSGLPKRASVTNVRRTKEDERKHKWTRRKLKRKGKSTEEIDTLIAEKDRVINPVILDENDMQEKNLKGISECIVDNWTVEAWYFDTQSGFKAKGFMLTALEKNLLTKPIYTIEPAFMGGGQRVFDPSNEEDVQELIKILNDDGKW